MKQLRKRVLSGLLVFVIAVTTVFANVDLAKAAEMTTIASWNITTSSTTLSDDKKSFAPDSGAGLLTTSDSATLTATNPGAKCNGWSTDRFWKISVEGIETYTALSLSFKATSSKTGPGTFHVYYALNDSEEWTDTESEYTVTTSSANVLSGGMINITGLDGTAEKITFKVIPTSDVAVNGSTVASTGTSAINAIVLTGSTTGEVPKPACAKVTTSVLAGSVEAGTKVTLKCATEGAQIYYNVDESSNFVPYTAGTEIEITEDTTIKCYASKDGYDASTTSSYKYTIKQETTETTEPTNPTETTPVVNAVTATKVTTISDGDMFVLTGKGYTTVDGTKVYGNYAVAPNSSTAAAVEITEDKLSVTSSVARLVASQKADGNFVFTCDGKYMACPATGGNISFVDTADDYCLWKVESKDDGSVLITNAKAAYSEKAQSLEIYGTTVKAYSYNSNYASSYALYPYLIKTGVKTYETDATVSSVLAQWGGNANYEAAGITTTVPADATATNDLLDTASSFKAVVNGKEVLPYTKATSSSTGSTSYYMGGTGVGSGTNDYLEFTTSSKGYGNMQIDFRMRSANTGAGSYQLQYSCDGVNYENFTTGTYSYAYTAYVSGTPSEVKGDGKITDGIAKTSLAPTYYISFHFDIPAYAANADTLYIRLVPGKEAAKSSSMISTSGTVRVDGVKISGSPIVDNSICSFVKADTASGNIPEGSVLTLTSATEGASIYYSVNGAAEQLYNASEKVTLSTLPAIVTAYAKKDGLADSVVMKYVYEKEKCSNVQVSPNGGAVTLGSKISMKCSTENATILYAVVKDGVAGEWQEYTDKIALTSLPTTFKVKAVKAGCTDSAEATVEFTQKSDEKYNIYFGQIHSHTNYSDGAGSCEEAFQYATKVDNLDYLAVTDHSNSLDHADSATITTNVDTADTDEWTQGHLLAEKYSSSDFTCIYGYEMTWSNGLGHMNTFNTEGFQSRTQTAYSSYATALQNYYAALNTAPNSISMFNHPGTTFGDFSDFAYYSQENDALINMVEVGNGEGAIGSSGYFPSYEYYTRALDKGWHVAPTNNQDNHKGKWGDANTGRTVVLADKNSQDDIYDAMRNCRIYATEDNNLSIYYTLDNYIMGTVLDQDQVGDTVSVKVDIKDADAKDKIGKVEVIVNGGLSIANETVSTNAKTVTFEVPSSYSYYYIKITEADGDIAVTAPVWVGEVEACGINGTSTATSLPVKNEAADITVDLYNNEKTELVIDKIEVSVDDTVIKSVTGAEAGISSVATNSTASYSFNYVYSKAGSCTYNITVYATLNGVEKVYKDVLEMNYATPEMVANVIIDGTHYNDYVNGYYGGNVTSLVKIAANKNIRATVVKDTITADMLKDCALLVLSAPAKKSGTANAGEFVPSHYSDEFLAMVADYVANGGSVIVCGMADYQDTTSSQTATEQNKLLAAIGSTIRMNSDEVYDTVNNGGQAYRMYMTNYNTESKYLDGVVDGQKYSQYSGCSVDITNAVANDIVEAAEGLVYGFDTTYSIDCKTDAGASSDSSKYVTEGNVVVLAHQATKAGGNIFVSGGIFMSDFEVDAEIDNSDSLPYSNYTIINNILKEVEVTLPVTPISEVRKAALDEIFAIEGYVTNGTNNASTTFFDSIYVQDDTAGIDIFPLAETGIAIGTKIRIIGYVDEYQGDRELQVMKYEILKDAPAKVYQPKVLSTQDAMNYSLYGGSLLKTTGKVTRVQYTSDGLGVSEFWLKDASGKEAAIFIDGYIYSAKTGKNELASMVKVGAEVSAVGVLYMHPEGDSDVSVPVFRVRNCDEIQLVTSAVNGESSLPVPNTVQAVCQVTAGTPETTLDTPLYTLYDTILTAEEKELAVAGTSVSIVLEVEDISEQVDEQTKEKVEEVLAEKFEDVKVDGIMYLDLSLFKEVGENRTQIEELGKEISISVKVPEELLLNSDSLVRDYYVVRVHDGVAEILDTTYNEQTGEIVFKTSKFSTYAIAYVDHAPDDVTSNTSSSSETVKPGKMGEATTPYAWYIVLMLMGAGAVLAARKRSQKN